MENEKQLEERYSTVPEEIRSAKRWVCYNLEMREGKQTKVPINAISGKYAKVDDKMTWTDFSTAILGCAKYGCAGLGFVLGNGVFGIDLDNHGEMSDDEFSALAKEFIDAMDSYAEYSQSGKGVHIICYGTLPKGRRRKGNVEMYDSSRFFAFTGNCINHKLIEERTEQVIPLWKKYVDDSEEKRKYAEEMAARMPLQSDRVGGRKLSDEEVVKKASFSPAFARLYAGDMSSVGGDHSKADMSLCNYLAFWTNCDPEQMDRIFRTSGLIREKWDSFRGEETYGAITIRMACASLPNGGFVYHENPKPVDYGISYGKPHEPVGSESTNEVTNEEIMEMKDSAENPDNFMNIDAKGNPIFRIKYNVKKDYKYDDTGNAERFYDYFGDCFKYNVDAKMFMFWTGKTWILDEKGIIRKYADKLIEIMNEDVRSMERDAMTLRGEGNEDESKKMEDLCEAARKNVKRIANKAGKDAMLSELQHINDVPVKTNEFNKGKFLLNTESGVVDLKTGKISVFDKDLMLSMSTNSKVSYEEPTVWLDFLNGIFWRGNDEKAKKETKEIIDFIHQALWLSLTGSTREQVMFMMYGNGSNGKSTFVEELAYMMGDYCKTIDSSALMMKDQKNTSVQFLLAELVGCRLLITKETDEGDRLAESTMKAMTGSDQINAQRKFGNPFQFMPQFKLWMMTNNLPIIRDTTDGTWRRMVPIPFLHKFADSEKDMDMPDKLREETPKILGWCIKGYEIYKANGDRLVMPDCIKEALKAYKEDMDVVSKFIGKCCRVGEAYSEGCKDVFSAFKSWAYDNKEFILRESKFSESMVKKGYRISATGFEDPKYVGIGLLPSYKANSYSPGIKYGPSFIDD